MYLEHYGLTEAPFRITPHTDFFFSGANRGATLEALLYAITHDEGIVKISGEVGSGKTMLCRVLMERLPENVVIIYLANPSLSREDILYALADELGISLPDHSRTSLVLRALQEKLVRLYSEGKQVVVLIDEAHAMPIETLEEIRLLSNLESNRHKLLQLVLFGQPEINETLSRTDMRQLRERITHNFNLEPLVRDDINAYLDFRMRAAGYRGPNVFSPAAVKQITEASLGLTRRVNILADKALLASFAAGGHHVDAKEVKAAIRDSEFSSAKTAAIKQGARARLISAAIGAAAMLAMVTGWYALTSNQQFNVLPASQPEPTSTVPISPQPISASPLPTPQPLAPAPQPGPTTVAPSEPSPPQVTQNQANDKPVAVEAGNSPSVETPKRTKTPLLDKLLADSRPWLDSVADSRWFVQLYRSSSNAPPEDVEYFLARLEETKLEAGQLRAYHLKIGEVSRFGVVYGDYASRKAAINGMNALPAEIKRYRPYPRQAIRLRPDNNTKDG